MKDALGTVQSVLVLGGGSDLALATCRRLAPRARTIVLAARKPETLDDAASTSCAAAGAGTVDTVAFDATDYASHDAFVAATFDRYGDFDVVLFAFGVLGDQADGRARSVAPHARSSRPTSSARCRSVCRSRNASGRRATARSSCCRRSPVNAPAGRTSSTGRRRPGFDAFFQGLGDALVGSGVHVMIVRPGFVHTKMTAGMKAAPLVDARPTRSPTRSSTGLRRGREIVWVPGALRWVMSVLRHVPRPVFRRLPL